MSDAYYPADDMGMMARGQAALDRDRHGAAWRETRAYKREQERVLSTAETLAYRDACAARGIKFTELDDSSGAERSRVRARHCEQAQAGYFYCGSTRNDPCGPALHPHTYCTAGTCVAGTPPALAQAAETRAFLAAALREDKR